MTTPAASSTRCPSATRSTRSCATAILEAAEGVPLFLEQLAAHAAESDLADDRIPSTLDALLASRIDALEPGERDVSRGRRSSGARSRGTRSAR